MKDFHDVLMDTAKKLCFTVVDVRTQTNINAFNSSVYLPDGVHPSEKGQKRVCAALCNAINGLYFE